MKNNFKENDLKKILRSIGKSVGPDEDFKVISKNILLERINSEDHRYQHPQLVKTNLFRFAASISIFVIILTGGTVFAAERSMPNDALYPVKILTEKAALKLSPPIWKKEVEKNIKMRRDQEKEQMKIEIEQNETPEEDQLKSDNKGESNNSTNTQDNETKSENRIEDNSNTSGDGNDNNDTQSDSSGKGDGSKVEPTSTPTERNLNDGKSGDNNSPTPTPSPSQESNSGKDH